MKKVFFVFKKEPMCFIHILLNSLEMNQKGLEVGIILEGEATTLVQEFNKPESPIFHLYTKTKHLFLGACKACSNKMGVLEEVKKLNLPLLAELKGHPSMLKYMELGYEVIVF